MELRVLRYFLAVAREENITRAAALLHVTQPTLSRQLMQLEELGVKLFRRGQYRVVLTDEGMLLRRRAQEILELAEKAERELSRSGGELSGEIAIGCGETRSMTTLSRHIRLFRQRYPQVRFRIYSAIADDVKERIEKGLLDMGLLTEPVDIGRYAFHRLPEKDRWGVLVPEDHPLAWKKDQTGSPAAEEFLRQLRNTGEAFLNEEKSIRHFRHPAVQCRHPKGCLHFSREGGKIPWINRNSAAAAPSRRSAWRSTGASAAGTAMSRA